MGPMDEPLGKAGITHLVEHLCYRRAGRFTHKDLYSKCEELGTKVAARTGKDFIQFNFICRVQVFLEVLAIFRSMLYEVNYCESDLVLEKKVIVAEIHEKDETNADSIINTLWSRDSYRTPILGTIESVADISLSDAINYKKDLLSNGGVIFVFGNFYESHITKIKELFGASLFANEATNDTVKHKNIGFASRQSESSVTFVADKFDDCDIYYAFDLSVSGRNRIRKIICMQMLHSILFQGDAAYMTEIIREEKGLIYSFFSRIEIIENELICLFHFSQNRDLLQNILQEVEARLLNFIAEEKYLKYVKAFFCDNISLLYDNQEDLTNSYTANYINFKKVVTPEEYSAIVKSLDPQEYLNIMRKLLKSKKIYVWGNIPRAERLLIKTILAKNS